MFRRIASRVAIASAVVMVAGGALATPALADGAAVAPKQYYYGEFFGLSTAAASNAIEVACAGPAAYGHPVAGQYVSAQELLPPVNDVTAGYTGNQGTEIDVNLVYASGTIVVVTPAFAEILYYNQKVEIPTSLTLPCSGTASLDFTPSPDTDGSGRASDLGVTFASTGV